MGGRIVTQVLVIAAFAALATADLPTSHEHEPTSIEEMKPQNIIPKGGPAAYVAEHFHEFSPEVQERIRAGARSGELAPHMLRREASQDGLKEVSPGRKRLHPLDLNGQLHNLEKPFHLHKLEKGWKSALSKAKGAAKLGKQMIEVVKDKECEIVGQKRGLVRDCKGRDVDEDSNDWSEYEGAHCFVRDDDEKDSTEAYNALVDKAPECNEPFLHSGGNSLISGDEYSATKAYNKAVDKDMYQDCPQCFQRKAQECAKSKKGIRGVPHAPTPKKSWSTPSPGDSDDGEGDPETGCLGIHAKACGCKHDDL